MSRSSVDARGPTRAREHLDLFRRTLANYVEADMECYRRYGDVVRLRFPIKGVAFFHPRHVKHILRTNVRNFPKSRMYETLRPILGNGLFMSDGDFWARQRRFVAPEFRQNAVERFLPVMIESTESMLDAWERSVDGAPRDITDDMMRLTLWIVGGAMFQSDFRHEAEEIGRALELRLEQSTKQMLSMGLLRPWMPTPGNLRARRAGLKLDRIVRDIIVRSRAQHAGKIDVLSRLIGAVDPETGVTMDDQQILDEVKSLILAGHETTSLTLSWTFQQLALHPHVLQKLSEEVSRVLGDRPVSADMIPELPYTRAVLFETMRLYPPVPSLSRDVIEPDVIDGTRIEPGEMAFVVPYVTHRHPQFWDNPEQYDPERFLGERAERIAPYSYMPFLLGRRACVGEHFAMLEGVVALAMMVRRFRLEPATALPVGIKPIATLRFERPLLMRVRRAAVTRLS